MATKDEATRTRIDNIKAELRSTSTCTNTTVVALQELLLKGDDGPEQKENVKVKVQAATRRRAGTTATAASIEVTKQKSCTLAPREKYILATEVANKTLQTLADALKNPPPVSAPRPPSKANLVPIEDARKPTKPRPGHTKSFSVAQKPLKERSVSQVTNSPRKPAPRRSSSYSSFLSSGPDPGLIATAECARVSFTFLGTPEAQRLLNKDSQELQYESGVLAFIGKLVALGLDALAVKELRTLKKRLDKFLGQGLEKQVSKAAARDPVAIEKESLASLLEFGTIDLKSPVVPLIASFQTYTLRIIAKLRKPRIVEAAQEHLSLSNPSSPANLLWHTAQASNNQAKAARQLESLAQTILSLCPSISSAEDANHLQPSAETILLLQHLAFKIQMRWWSLVKHQGNHNQELLEPFGKCLVAFARRSQLAPKRKYEIAESLYTGLAHSPDDSSVSTHGIAVNAAIAKTLSCLAQAAGRSEDALRWLGSPSTSVGSSASAAKQAARAIRIANVSLDAYLKGDERSNLELTITNALDVLSGSLGGSSKDLESLFVEANALRRTATRLLLRRIQPSADVASGSPVEKQAVPMIVASVHFSARFIGSALTAEADQKEQLRHGDRIAVAWKCAKNIIDSVIACCKQDMREQEQWQELDALLQECSHIVRRFGEEIGNGTIPGAEDAALVQSYTIKLSNAYWAVHLQLRKGNLDSECSLIAMHRSISLIQTGTAIEQDSGLLPMKLEQLGETLERASRIESSRRAFHQCITSHLSGDTPHRLSKLAAMSSLSTIFSTEGTLSVLIRVMKAYHHSFIKFGINKPAEMAYYDNGEFGPEARGALLEWQLTLYLRTLSRNRQWDSKLNKSVQSMIGQLQSLYTAKEYPVRHLRLSITLLQLSQNHPHIVMEDFVPPPPMSEDVKASGTRDEKLVHLESHLRTLHSFKLAMQQAPLPTSTYKQCLATWERLVKSISSWDDLAGRIGDVEDWLQDLKAALELFNAKGEEYLALPLLHLLLSILKLQTTSDASDHVTTLSTLGLQFLRLGYTGKAGLSLAKAQTLIEHQATSTEVKLQWHMAYAEYLLGVGNHSKSSTTMAAAQSLALADRQFMDLAKPTTALSGRIRFNRMLADASYIYSLLATVKGSYKDAARHARQCVTLNRRIWAALESRANANKPIPEEGTESDVDGSSRPAFDPLSSMRNDKGQPLVMSVTHDALNSAPFWSLVPALYRALMQHSQIYAHQGLLQEAIYVAEQAEKVASGTNSLTLLTDNASWRADCWAQSGRSDKAATILKSFELDPSRKCLSVAGYHSAVARMHHVDCQHDEEIASYNRMEQLLKDLMSPSFIRSLEAVSSPIDTLADQISTLSLEASETQNSKPVTKTRKTATKSAPRTTSRPTTTVRSRVATTVAAKSAVRTKRQPVPSPSLEVPSVGNECTALNVLEASMRDRAVLANILRDDLAEALNILEQVKLGGSLDQEVSHMWATFKTKYAQSVKQIAEDFTVNTLPESTIAFPALGLKERRLSEGQAVKKATLISSTATKGVRAKKHTKEDFRDTLRVARERLVEAHALCAANGSNYSFRQSSLALGQVTVLLSAVCGVELQGSLHPLYAAYMSEIPKCNALRLVQESTEAEKENMSRDDCLRWPVPEPSRIALASVPDFQKDYVDIIPDTWTAISLALSEGRDELYITRFENGVSPFVLRLPLARHTSRDLDEEEFSFDDGKRDFDEIIELSDFSTRSAKDMTSRDARQQWWAEREALDTRLRELLVNMENIWLGGFKGIFSQCDRQPALLSRFRKSFDNILNEHLPSRRKKSQQKRPALDTRVLELFIGLGDATDEELDLDEALTDLIYFVVDILQFNGECNAYDELDFDAMVVETHDALKAYHSACHKVDATSRHTILILDNNLHAFPWESLPCLETLSISRLPSLAALRERILATRYSEAGENAIPGHYIRTDTGGTSVLNPSGDLSHTSKTIKPRLDELQGPWSHIANRAPSEKEFEDSLREKDLVLYFGHGSGAQYIKSKSVRRLYSERQDNELAKPGCATTLLFGCSSVHLTENGIYEPSGMLASYLTAGAPAVVGMLWDVTDKDCDRFAVKAGELWGLWPEPQEDVPPPKTPAKTPAKKAKGKGRVAQLVDEVEGVRSVGGSARKGKRAAKVVDEDVGIDGDRQRGLGLDEAVRDARKVCVLRYLNGAAAVVYGIPVYLE